MDDKGEERKGTIVSRKWRRRSQRNTGRELREGEREGGVDGRKMERVML